MAPFSEFVFWMDDDTVVQDIDEALAALLEVDRADVVGRPLAELSWFSAADTAKLVTSAAAGHRAATGGLHLCISTPSGARALELCAYATAGRTVCIAREPGAHDQQRRMYSLLRYALEHIGEGIYLMRGRSPAFEYVNAPAADSLGYSVEELVGGMGVLDIDPGLSRAAWDQLIPEVMRRGTMTIQTTHRRRDGCLLPVEVTGNFFEYGGELYNLAISRSIAERQRADQALRASERAYRSLVENLPDLVARWDRELRRVFANSAYIAAMSRVRQDTSGARASDAAAGEVDIAGARLSEAIAAVFETGQPASLEQVFQTPSGAQLFQIRLVPERDDDGAVQTVLGIARDISQLERAKDELRSLAEGSPDLILRTRLDGRLDYRNRPVAEYLGTTDGAAEAVLLARLEPELLRAQATPLTTEVELRLTDRACVLEVRIVPEPQHAPLPTLLVVVRDVTEARQAAHQQREGQRMELVGRLAGGVAHDFNNLLTAMLIQVGFLEGEPGLTAPAHETCADLRATVGRATDLVRQLLTFGRRKPASPADVAVGPRLYDFARIMGQLLGAGVRVDLDIPADLPHVKVDPVMFEQVVMNLALNARDAMSGRGRLSIAAAVVDRAPRGAGRASPARRFVRMDVRDEGVGIPADVLPHIFEPFFTTKDSGRGTGLGLATVQAIAHQHGGCVTVDSAVGLGTTFYVYLPVVEAQAPRPTSQDEHLLASAGSEVVLLVEPEDQLRRSSRSALERLGYAVLDAGTGPEAERVWRDVHGNVRVLVVDAVMPGVSGRELVASLRGMRPRLRVVYLAPFEPGLAASLDLGVRTRLLLKPFDAGQLAAAVRAALDES